MRILVDKESKYYSEFLHNLSSSNQTKYQHEFVRKQIELLTNIDEFQGYGQHICDDGMEFLQSFFRSNKFIKKVDLGLNSLQNESMISLASIMSVNHTIQELNLSINSISNEGVSALMKALKENKNTSLTVLDFSKNCIGNSGASSIAEYLETRDYQLIKLKLSWNVICDDGAMALVKSLDLNATLEFLDLQGNDVSSKTLKFLQDISRNYETLLSF